MVPVNAVVTRTRVKDQLNESNARNEAKKKTCKRQQNVASTRSQSTTKPMLHAWNIRRSLIRN